MISEQRFTGLVEAIYEAGADFRRWPDALKQITQAYHARTVVFGAYSMNADDCCVIAPDIDQSVHERYATYYHAINPIWYRTIDMAPGEVRSDAMIVPRREFEASEFFHDFLRPQDIGSMLGVAAHNQNARLCVVSVQRKRPFDEDDIAIYRRLGPHVRRAVELNMKLAHLDMTSAQAAEALDALTQGVLLVDGHARVRFSNREAERLFADHDGLQLQDGVLHTRSLEETSRLHALVRGCDEAAGDISPGGAIAVSRGPARAKVRLSITPLRGRRPASLLQSGAVAIILVDDCERTAVPAKDRLRARYGLTPKEIAFATEVLKGGSIQACADRLGISRATAQTHLAHIFQKTSVSRQTELVRLLMQP